MMHKSTFLNTLRKVFSFFSRSDLILVFLIILISVFLLVRNVSKEEDKIVRINYQNKLYGNYKLSKDQIIEINQDIKVEIADNKVRMLENNCPNKLCVDQGWSQNYPIICVPNQVEIIILNENSKDEIRHIIK